jgi:RND family efflux transporter MFP subunit
VRIRQCGARGIRLMQWWFERRGDAETQGRTSPPRWQNPMQAMRQVPPRALAVAAGLAVLASGLWWWQRLGPGVAAVAVTRGTAVEIVYATGAVEPVRWAKVTSLVRNRILDVCYCEGKTVVKGDVLARLDDREPRAQLEELRAREEFAKREMERVTQLLGRGVATIQTHEKMGMDLRQVQALISVQMEKLAYYTITAPMDGLVLRRDGEVGEIAEPGQVLFRVGVPKPLQIVAEVNEVDIPRVAVGQTVLLRTDAFASQRLDGRVREITPMGDTITKTYRIRIGLPDDTPLIAGMSVEANVITREKANVLLVPADAVQDASVFVIDGNRLRRRRIVIGIRGTRSLEVLSGVQEGEKLASPAPTGGADGQRVRPIAPAK